MTALPELSSNAAALRLEASPGLYGAVTPSGAKPAKSFVVMLPATGHRTNSRQLDFLLVDAVAQITASVEANGLTLETRTPKLDARTNAGSDANER
jgi:hypothetical protein